MKHKQTRTLDRVMATDLTAVAGGYEPVDGSCFHCDLGTPGSTGTSFTSWDGTWYSTDGCDED